MKVAIYARVSTRMQFECGISLEAQKNELIEYCVRNNYEYEIIEEGKGISGKNIKKRKQFKNLLENRLDEFDIVLCYKLARISRSLKDLANMLDTFKKHNVRLISLNENIDTASPMGKMLVYVMGIVSEIERDNISAYVKLARKEEFHMGKSTVKAILGYDVIKKLLKLNKKEAKIVNFVFKTYDKIRNYYQVAQICNNKGYRGKNGNLFHASSIKKIIQNITYCGYSVFHDEIRKGEHEAIIDLELFKKVNNIDKDDPIEKYYHIAPDIKNIA